MAKHVVNVNHWSSFLRLWYKSTGPLHLIGGRNDASGPSRTFSSVVSLYLAREGSLHVDFLHGPVGLSGLAITIRPGGTFTGPNGEGCQL